MSTTPPDDPVDLIKGLLKTQAAFVHEHTAAARAEAAASFELARELEQAVSTESEAVKAAFARMLEDIATLRLNLKRADLLGVLQTGMLRSLIVMQFNKDFQPELLRMVASEYSQQLLAGYEELADWPDEKFSDYDALEEFQERVVKGHLPSEEPRS